MSEQNIKSVHPFADAFPMMTDQEMDRLVADIQQHGQQEACIVNSEGVLLDGRNRRAACQRLGIAPVVRRQDPESETAFIISLNVARRHLNPDQLAIVAAKALPHFEAEALQRKSQGGKGGIEDVAPGPHLARAPLARDLAAQAVGASGRSVARVKRITEHAPELVDEVWAGNTTLKEAESVVRSAQAKQRFIERKAEWDEQVSPSDRRWTMHLADFRDILATLEDGSVDAIITDPPYPDEFLPLWGDLAEHAARVLRPGAPLIAWSGQYRLREVLNHLCGPLRYQWTICLDMPGANARFRGPNMIQTWKPVIVTTAGAWGPHDWYRDRVVSPKKDQALYEWQQNPDPAAELIDRYVPPNGLVLDPFAGVGSFGVAALATGRRFIGIELDEERHATASVRLDDADD